MMNKTLSDKSVPPYGWVIFVLLAVIGLYLVKWSPYYHRAFVAEAQHSIGKSILMGTSAAPPEPSLAAALDYAWAYGKAIWQAMVLGLLLGSAVQTLLPMRWIERVLGSRGLGSVAAGCALSLPGMMCTCCAAPVVAGLRERRASAGAAVSFWLGNTVLNPATLVFMGFVLGWEWSALRLVMGLVLVLGLGWFINQHVPDAEFRHDDAAGASQANPAAERTPDVDASHPLLRWLRVLLRMTVRLVPEYIVLVLLLGAARAWLFPHIDADIGNQLGWIAAFAIAGMLFVIPTAGEIPIIQAMLGLGLGVGPAAALLMTLPPVSLPSLAMVGRSFRLATLIQIAVAVVLVGLITGLLAVLLGMQP